MQNLGVMVDVLKSSVLYLLPTVELPKFKGFVVIKTRPDTEDILLFVMTNNKITFEQVLYKSSPQLYLTVTVPDYTRLLNLKFKH